MGDLVRFQSMYKFVLLAYGEKHLRGLGRGSSRMRIGGPLRRCLRATGPGSWPLSGNNWWMPRARTFINVFQHIAGFFSDGLTAGEKAHLGGLATRFRAAGRPWSSVTALLESRAVRFGGDYILDQALFAPFPEALVSEADSGKGRGGVRGDQSAPRLPSGSAEPLSIPPEAHGKASTGATCWDGVFVVRHSPVGCRAL